MRRSVSATAAIVGCCLAACADHPDGQTAGGSTGDAASCAAIVEYDGHTYVGMGLPRPGHPQQYGAVPSSRMHPLGSARTPPCQDTNDPGDRVAAQRVRVAGIEGYPPRQVITLQRDGSIYVRRGSQLPESLRHAPWLHWVRP